MPEIGECYSIASAIPNIKKIEKLSVSKRFKTNILKNKSQDITKIIGFSIEEIKAYGKSIMFLLSKENEKIILVSQLGMTGSWFVNDVMEERGNDHLILHSKSDKIRYSDPRMFGKMELFFGTDFSLIHEEIIKKNKWGIDPFLSSTEAIKLKLIENNKSKQSIKKKLLDQDKLFGIGNYLASEVLFDSCILPSHKCTELSENQYFSLSKSIKKIVSLAVEKKGFSFAGGYIRPDGSFGTMSDSIRVYGKKECPNCNQKLVHDFINQRITYWCRKCQK